MPAEPLPRTHRLLDDAHACVAHGLTFSAMQQHPVSGHEGGDCQEQPQDMGMQEFHGSNRNCSHSMISLRRRTWEITSGLAQRHALRIAARHFRDEFGSQ